MSFWDLIYQKKCLGCGRVGQYFCDQCLKTGEISDECFNNHLSLFCYRGLIREAIKQLKFRFLKDIEGELKQLIESGLRHKLTQPNTDLFREFLALKPVVQPLPLHWFRENRRGFNQAELIGQIISRQLRLKLIDRLERVKLTTPQSRLPREERLTNVKDIFQVKPGHLPKSILLIDDVWTTGSTMREAIKVLKEKGVREIWGLSLAR
ncbi:hypothetical protein COW80_01710 [Candidatus Beckwithbacteria bacterium CG22_combo_CG10-13_8_21_14_all_01_47_9]|uniref:Uncharacterized protein n=5 Tax=Candidatus Beckwithiibacteriota TaxID=1752726 RepID=A0A2H0E180_9BACT|nr:MAG: hypothetical protein AUJ59_02750 [Candidatus Beckwithbacteria bacterium CG1_02_47_37]PIP52690.1 MAG: hypothetical protein COX09_00180 [Candidatus Beckwithbacteria bacterium CG23_combo_of_CG06-09_8_20_14_all_47_9]PIP88184.1 MAG: hypothetical protein COW80_01710 [Candidatus Beckwithbacteria bacterium CG22_combo_CG10-13_8_21_14_all_01_47_9]PJA22757.1 MAG: hypothetical protein COX59_02140 [Candidatus Beckwithbacteria bacterium CG_4_10_14_0_2_um_filter_47_25]PJC66676.1 MAG: hypothetical prot